MSGPQDTFNYNQCHSPQPAINRVSKYAEDTLRTNLSELTIFSKYNTMSTPRAMPSGIEKTGGPSIYTRSDTFVTIAIPRNSFCSLRENLRNEYAVGKRNMNLSEIQSVCKLNIVSVYFPMHHYAFRYKSFVVFKTNLSSSIEVLSPGKNPTDPEFYRPCSEVFGLPTPRFAENSKPHTVLSSTHVTDMSCS